MTHGTTVQFVCLWVCLFMRISEGFNTFGGFYGPAEPKFNTSDVLGNILAYCPLHQSCDGEDHNVRNESSMWLDGCCLHCDCSDDCFVTGNCCPGKEHRQELNAPKQCVQTFSYLEPLPYSEQKFLNSSYVLKIFDIPSQCVFNIGEKCLSPNNSSISENTPVYVKSRKVNYRNVFCAKCDGNNDDDDIVSWPVRIECLSYDSDVLRLLLRRNGENDFQIFDRLQNDRCQMFWDPAEPEETEWCIHENDIVSTCRYTSRSHLQFQIEHCTADLQGLYNPIVYDNVLYKNVYCFDCNTDLPYKLDFANGVCKSDIYAPEPTKFVTLLDISAYLLQDSVGDCLDFNVVSTVTCHVIMCRFVVFFL